MMSLDLVKIVGGYIAHPTATASATSTLLLTFALKDIQLEEHEMTTVVAVDPNNNKIWATMTNQAQIFSADGEFLQYAAKGRVEGLFGIAIAANGDACMADWEGNCIFVCQPNGKIARRIGGKHQFDRPSFVAVDVKQDLVFVSDSHNYRVQVLNLDGSIVRTLGSRGRGDGELGFIRGIALSKTGEVAVCDMDRHRVQV